MNPTLILYYHRVNQGIDDPFHLCVSRVNFAHHLKLLARRASFVTLDEAVHPADHPRVVITFDDGYADNLLLAAPIARRLDVPMTVYVTSAMVGDSSGFWWDRLAHLVRRGSAEGTTLRLSIRSRPLVTRLDDPSDAPVVLAELRELLLRCNVEEIEQVLGSMAAQLGVASTGPADARPLTKEELRELSGFENITIGAHTTHHVQLRSLRVNDQFETILRSKEDLETVVGGSVRHFAYPFGGLDSFDEVSVAAVRKAGFATAATAIPGSVGRRPDPLRLRRRGVMNWPPWRFRAQMLRWGLR